MSTEKLLSVIVPSYNMEAYLAKNISSMMVQDEALRQLVEVIVVNDGSKDRTSEIAHDFSKKYPGCVTVIDKPNGHYGSCINAALPVAKGKYIRILDADDYMNEEAFEDFLKYLRGLEDKEIALDLIISDRHTVDLEGRVRISTHYELPHEITFTLNSVVEQLTSTFVGLHSITYNTQMLRDMDYRQTEGCAYTDMEWYIVPMSRVKTVQYFPGYVTCYLLGRDGQTMEAETFARNYGVTVKLMGQIVKHYADLYENAMPEAALYFERLVKQMAKCRYLCLLNEHLYCNEELMRFDNFLKEFDFSFYNHLNDEVTPSRKFRFHYIKIWRKKFSRDSILFKLYFYYTRLIKWGYQVTTRHND